MMASTNSSTHESGVTYIQHHPKFSSIVGANPRADVLCQSQNGEALFHEACIYHAASRSIFVTSNQLPTAAKPPYHKTIALYRIYDAPLDEPASPAIAEPITFPGIEGAFLNGGINYTPESILLCAQGSLNKDDLSGIIQLKIPSMPHPNEQSKPTTTPDPFPAPTRVISSFHGHPFNSVNDVIVHPLDASIWFTDPCYGYHQTIRDKPSLPNQVYRFDPITNSIRCLADGFTRPNGLCFSPDFKTLYVTDTGAVHGSADIEFDPAGPSHIYAFDIIYPTFTSSDASTAPNLNANPFLPLYSAPIVPDTHNLAPSLPSTTRTASPSPFLTNRRTFAYAPGNCPDGIKTDMAGNVYSGCWDGIWVWNSAGDALGVIAVAGGVANFCFGEQSTIYACNETRVIRIRLDGEEVRGALLGL